MSRKISEYPAKASPAGTDELLIVDRATNPISSKRATIASLPGGADGSVTTAKLADDAVTQAKIADDAVGADQLADDVVTQVKIADDAVGVPQLKFNTGQQETVGNILKIGANGNLDASSTVPADAPLWTAAATVAARSIWFYNGNFWGAKRVPVLMHPGGPDLLGGWRVVAASETSLGNGECQRVTQNTNILYCNTTPSTPGARAGSDGIISTAEWFATSGTRRGVTLQFVPDGGLATSITTGEATFVNNANNRLELSVNGITANIGTTAGGVVYLWNTNNSAAMVRRPPAENADWTQLDFPTPPAAAGSYDLRVVVDAQGNAVKQWVAANQLHGQGIPNPF